MDRGQNGCPRRREGAAFIRRPKNYRTITKFGRARWSSWQPTAVTCVLKSVMYLS
jgi:hypothetical protein